MPTQPGTLETRIQDLLPKLERVYTDIHAHPELSMQETRTARIAADRLRSAGFDVLAIGAVVALPVLFATNQLPLAREEPVAFVTVPPPPPPPPAPAAKPAASRPAPTQRSNPRPPAVTTRSRPVPVEAPASLEPPTVVGENFAGFPGVPGGIVAACPVV